MKQSGVDHQIPPFPLPQPFSGKPVCRRVNYGFKRRKFPALAEDQHPKLFAVNRTPGSQNSRTEAPQNGVPLLLNSRMPQFVHIQDRNPALLQKAGDVVLSRAVRPGKSDCFSPVEDLQASWYNNRL